MINQKKSFSEVKRKQKIYRADQPVKICTFKTNSMGFQSKLLISSSDIVI